MENKTPIEWIVTACLLFPLSAGTVLLRLLAVRDRRSGLSSSDYLVCLALLCETGFLVVAGLGNQWFGKHMVDLTAKQEGDMFKSTYAFTYLWSAATTSCRLAILLLYMEIFRYHVVRRLIITTLGLNVTWWATTVVLYFVLCRPISYGWDPIHVQGSCGNTHMAQTSTAIVNMFLDLGAVFIPLPVLWKLQLSSHKKAIVTTSFSLGIITAGVNVGRLIQYNRCLPGDRSYCAVANFILAFAEVTSGILVASIPTVQKFLGKMWKTWVTDSGQRNVESKPANYDHLPTIGSLPVRQKLGSEDFPLLLLTQSAAPIAHLEQPSRVALKPKRSLSINGKSYYN